MGSVMRHKYDKSWHKVQPSEYTFVIFNCYESHITNNCIADTAHLNLGTGSFSPNFTNISYWNCGAKLFIFLYIRSGYFLCKNMATKNAFSKSHNACLLIQQLFESFSKNISMFLNHISMSYYCMKTVFV